MNKRDSNTNAESTRQSLSEKLEAMDTPAVVDVDAFAQPVDNALLLLKVLHEYVEMLEVDSSQLTIKQTGFILIDCIEGFLTRACEIEMLDLDDVVLDRSIQRTIDESARMVAAMRERGQASRGEVSQ